ncbi:cytochrome P450 [Gordonia sp. NPDC003585]|uniref:cytochrome P450 n=1 Tax=unclassified Gordonia (in: high G+C Gram-positive bacteria) TaxID=2657482 RepID=UPI0033A26628
MIQASELFSDEVLQDPYPTFDRLLADGNVHYLADQQLYVVLGFDAIREVLADPATYSSNLVALLTTGAESAELQVADTGGVDVLATSDPPTHTTHRALVQPRFSQRAVRDLQSDIDALLEPRIKQLVADGGGDWMRSIATTVPVRVIGYILGLPEDDFDQLAAWSDDAIALVSGVATPERIGEAMMRVIEFSAYLGKHLDAAVEIRTGAMLDIIADAVADGTLTRDQGTMFLVQLVTAGAESTTSLLGTCARLVASDASVQAELRADPGRIPALVEEAVRLESPFRGHFRTTTCATTLDGVDIEEGARLMLLWGASNRDSSTFDHPAEINFDRPQPRLHHSFGRGIHFCIGAHLARLEACRAIELLLAATSDVRMSTGVVRYVPSLVVRRLAELELSVS